MDLNHRPPGPEKCNQKIQVLHLVSLRSRKAILSLPQLSFRAYGPVGVGIAMARDPLRRSGQALLTHPAPTLGDNAQALERIGMTNANRGEPALDVSPQAAPRQRFLTPASQSSPPQAPYCLVKRG